jgi:protein-S-isoprenylcysteine O-methyltransferase Ste14
LRKAILALSAVLAFAFVIVGESRWPDGSTMHESIEWAGLALIVVCIVGRTWSTLYIGGRKNDVLVTEGPYSITRNPLYLFSIIGAAGAGAQLGSMTAALAAGFIAWIVFRWTARREEAAILAAFPQDYPRYFARVPRFLPRFRLWSAPATIVVHPRTVVTTFLDALIFLAAIPVAELFDVLHDSGILPAYLTIP